jgi:hypothetical protein
MTRMTISGDAMTGGSESSTLASRCYRWQGRESLSRVLHLRRAQSHYPATLTSGRLASHETTIDAASIRDLYCDFASCNPCALFAAAPSRRQPAPIRPFTGRRLELKALDELLGQLGAGHRAHDLHYRRYRGTRQDSPGGLLSTAGCGSFPGRSGLHRSSWLRPGSAPDIGG